MDNQDPISGAAWGGADWPEAEMGHAPLGNVRRSRRLVHCVQVQARSPAASFPVAAPSDRAAVKGHSRLIDHPDPTHVPPEKILEPHRQRTAQRLCVQDGTDLNFAVHPGCAGLSLIGKNQGAAGTLGLPMHTVSHGVPDIQFRTRHDRRLDPASPKLWVALLQRPAAEGPDLSPLVLFTSPPLEIQVLRDLAWYRGWALPATLGAMVLVLARLDGYLVRHHDPPPGPPTRPWQASHAYRPTDLWVMGSSRDLHPPQKRPGACSLTAFKRALGLAGA